MVIFTKKFVNWANSGYPNNFEKFKKIVLDIVEALDLNSKTITFDVDPKNLNASCREAVDPDIEDPKLFTGNEFIIEFQTKCPIYDEFEFAFMAAHELRHAWQYSHKMLSTVTLSKVMLDLDVGIHQTVCQIWDEDVLYVDTFYTKNVVYGHLPWEHDANTFAWNFIKEKKIKNTFKTNFWGNIIDINMESLSSYNEEATIEILKNPKHIDDIVIQLVTEEFINYGYNLKTKGE